MAPIERTAGLILLKIQAHGEVTDTLKATGIVRRMDDLGRVVIPKEIRRTMRIREGDPLEIYTDTDGEVIFKKYSPIEEMTPFAEQYAQTLASCTGLAAVICDRDHVVAGSGVPKREIADRRISQELEEYIERRDTFTAAEGTGDLFPIEGYDRPASVMYPVVASGDVAGSVLLLLPEDGKLPTQTEIKLVQAAATLIGKQMEG